LEMGQKARRFVMEHYSREKAARELERLLIDAVLKENPANA